MDNRIKVGVRVRPLSKKELTEGGTSSSVTTEDTQGRIVVSGDNNARKNGFSFDWVFGVNSEQRQLYDSMCMPLIEKFFEGYNATFFACKI